MAKVIMVQGTMSNVGKSFLVAGLCRVFKQDGYKVAPFKSQNMALNSYITEEGLEMGRAQVMQAEAAKIKPTVSMNPILLKPNSDMGSQVIVNGKVLGNMPALEYFKYKDKLLPEVLKAYETLSEEYDIIVIEGAGSPAEINLKKDVFVNMGLAKQIKAPVLLVGDIDRGGVFAQILGTVMLLEEEEQKLIKGLVINKFRGDIRILDPGLDMMEERSQKPVLGVIPYLKVDIEDEDSLSERLWRKKEADVIDIAVIRLPRLSNFTDFNPLECIPGVSLRYITSVNELGNPDLIILPGTKSTMADLMWLRQNGLEAAIKKAAAKDTLVWGICGGYQMLGISIIDPLEVEGIPYISGMGLLPMQTEFKDSKICTQVEGTFHKIKGPFEKLSEVAFRGYEIHMGESYLGELRTGEPNTVLNTEKLNTEKLNTEKLNTEKSIKDESNKYESNTGKWSIGELNTDELNIGELSTGELSIGELSIGELSTGVKNIGDNITSFTKITVKQNAQSKNDGAYLGNICGTYVHGIFEEEGVRKALLSILCERKGINEEEIGVCSMDDYKEEQYDLLAKTVREHLDMKKIYEILEEGV